MNMHNKKVIDFINRFTFDGAYEQVIKTFTQGCCYWFARVLYDRFSSEYDSFIVIDPVELHFATSINGYVYDITGDITDTCDQWTKWDEYELGSGFRRSVIHDTINFEEDYL